MIIPKFLSYVSIAIICIATLVIGFKYSYYLIPKKIREEHKITSTFHIVLDLLMFIFSPIFNVIRPSHRFIIKSLKKEKEVFFQTIDSSNMNFLIEHAPVIPTICFIRGNLIFYFGEKNGIKILYVGNLAQGTHINMHFRTLLYKDHIVQETTTDLERFIILPNSEQSNLLDIFEHVEMICLLK